MRDYTKYKYPIEVAKYHLPKRKLSLLVDLERRTVQHKSGENHLLKKKLTSQRQFTSGAGLEVLHQGVLDYLMAHIKFIQRERYTEITPELICIENKYFMVQIHSNPGFGNNPEENINLHFTYMKLEAETLKRINANNAFNHISQLIQLEELYRQVNIIKNETNKRKVLDIDIFDTLKH